MDELETLRDENRKLKAEVRRLRAAFGLGIGRIRPTGEGVSILEQRYPHVAAKIMLYWGTRQFIPYAESLLLDDRGDREGFPFEALQEIHFLIETHKQSQHVDLDWTDNYMR